MVFGIGAERAAHRKAFGHAFGIGQAEIGPVARRRIAAAQSVERDVGIGWIGFDAVDPDLGLAAAGKRDSDHGTGELRALEDRTVGEGDDEGGLLDSDGGDGGGLGGRSAR